MPETARDRRITTSQNSPHRGCIEENTCACGEKHGPQAGTSHRESCTSPLKYGDTCCCRSEEAQKNHFCRHNQPRR